MCVWMCADVDMCACVCGIVCLSVVWCVCVCVCVCASVCVSLKLLAISGFTDCLSSTTVLYVLQTVAAHYRSVTTKHEHAVTPITFICNINE